MQGQNTVETAAALAELSAAAGTAPVANAIIRASVRMLAPIDAAWLLLPGPHRTWQPRAAWGPPSPPATATRLANDAARARGPVSAEGMSLTAIPMTAGPRTPGVLLLSRGTDRAFTADDLTVAGDLANVMAWRLDAELAQDQLRASTDQAASERDEDRNTTNLLDAILDLLATDEPSTSHLMDALGQQLGGVAWLIDPRRRIMAGKPVGDLRALSHRIQALLDDSSDAPVLTSDVAPALTITRIGAVTPSWLLILQTDTALGPRRQQDFLRAARLIETVVRRWAESGRAYAEVRAGLLSELLTARGAPSPALTALADMRSFDLNATYVVLCLHPREPRAGETRELAETAARFGGLGGPHGDALVALIPAENPLTVTEKVAGELSAETVADAAICFSAPVVPRDGGLADACDMVVHGAALLSVLGFTGRPVATDDLLIYRKLFDPDRATDLRTFAKRTLEPLIRYDARNKTDLLRTVQALMANNGNVAQTARSLYIHTNTMTRRLERIGSLLGPDWQTNPFNLHLRLALRLLAIGGEEPTKLT